MKNNIGIAVAGGLGLAFIGYCFYFDRKRRSDPDFKKKLIEKRMRQKKARADKDSLKYPDLTNETAIQSFFMSEIALGEQLMGLGDIENGVEHLANAVAVTAHKENLLNVLRSTLPDPIFRLLVEKLPEVSQKIYNSSKMKTASSFRFESENKIVEVNEENLAIDECLD
jgi:import receptor subunit TOM20